MLICATREFTRAFEHKKPTKIYAFPEFCMPSLRIKSLIRDDENDYDFVKVILLSYTCSLDLA